jgi:hypothetical protein
LENNGGRGITKAPELRQELPIISLPREAELNRELSTAMDSLIDAIDSPRTHLILRNAVLTLLELPGEDFSIRKVYELLTDDRFRSSVISRLGETTPPCWSEEWSLLWRKDADPLLSISQQRIVRLTGLLTFWTKEWGEIQYDIKRHIAEMLKGMAEG